MKNQANYFEMTHPEELLVRFLMLEFILKKHIPLKGSQVPNIDVHSLIYEFQFHFPNSYIKREVLDLNPFWKSQSEVIN